MFVNKDAEPRRHAVCFCFSPLSASGEMALESYCIFRSDEASVIKASYANALWCKGWHVTYRKSYGNRSPRYCPVLTHHDRRRLFQTKKLPLLAFCLCLKLESVCWHVFSGCGAGGAQVTVSVAWKEMKAHPFTPCACTPLSWIWVSWARHRQEGGLWTMALGLE